MAPALIRITSIDCAEGQVLKVGFQSQDGVDWFPQSKTLVEYPSQIEEHIQALKHIPDRIFDTSFLEPQVLKIELQYFKPSKDNENPDPNALQLVNVVAMVAVNEAKKGQVKLPKVGQYYSADGAGEARYLKSSECIAIEAICNLLSEAIAEEANTGPVFKPVQMNLRFGG